MVGMDVKPVRRKKRVRLDKGSVLGFCVLVAMTIVVALAAGPALDHDDYAQQRGEVVENLR